MAFVDQGYTGEAAAQAAEKHGLRLEVMKLAEAKKGFVLLPRRGWVSGVLVRQRDFGGWREITNDCRKHWPDCIF